MLFQTLFKSFKNDKTKRKKRDKNKYKRKKKVEKDISDTYCLLYQMENYKKQYKKEERNWNWNVYVLQLRSVKLVTAHFEISLLTADAPRNAIQIIQ